MCNWRSAAQFEERIVEAHDLFLFDCDGCAAAADNARQLTVCTRSVLWHGSDAIAGSVALVRRLQARANARVVFVSNNATKSRRTYVDKFAALGLTVDESHVFSAAYAAAAHLCAQVRACARAVPRV